MSDKFIITFYDDSGECWERQYFYQTKENGWDEELIEEWDTYEEALEEALELASQCADGCYLVDQEPILYFRIFNDKEAHELTFKRTVKIYDSHTTKEISPKDCEDFMTF